MFTVRPIVLEKNCLVTPSESTVPIRRSHPVADTLLVLFIMLTTRWFTVYSISPIFSSPLGKYGSFRSEVSVVIW
jgi:hypothetical protein